MIYALEKDDVTPELRGLAGIALGMFELAMPLAVARADGLERGAESVVRMAGAHKLAIGLGLLLARHKGPWLVGALAGSAFDAIALMKTKAKPSAYARLAAVASIDTALLASTAQRP